MKGPLSMGLLPAKIKTYFWINNLCRIRNTNLNLFQGILLRKNTNNHWIKFKPICPNLIKEILQLKFFQLLTRKTFINPFPTLLIKNKLFQFLQKSKLIKSFYKRLSNFNNKIVKFWKRLKLSFFWCKGTFKKCNQF